MNNKGFAITAVLYGLLVVFLLIVIGTLASLSNYKNIMEELIDGNKGARSIGKLDTITITTFPYTTEKRALYVYRGCKKYYNANETLIVENFNADCIQ